MSDIKKSYRNGKIYPIKIFRNWLHQGITYMDFGERFSRVVIEAGLILVICFFMTRMPLPIANTVLFALVVFVVHTLNWIFNGNIWALLQFSVPGIRPQNEAETILYLNRMGERLQKSGAIDGVMLFGSVARGKWHKMSDLDMRFVRRAGALNLIISVYVTMRERVIAAKLKQPLDLFLADNVNYLKKMRTDETPIFLVKKSSILEDAYPKNGAICLLKLS